jgi:hypothetical protein
MVDQFEIQGRPLTGGLKWLMFALMLISPCMWLAWVLCAVYGDEKSSSGKAE